MPVDPLKWAGAGGRGEGGREGMGGATREDAAPSHVSMWGMRIGHVPGNISLPKGQCLCLIPAPPMAWGHHSLLAGGGFPGKVWEMGLPQRVA